MKTKLWLSILIISTVLLCGFKPLTPQQQYLQELEQDLNTPAPRTEQFVIIPPMTTENEGKSSFGITYPDGTTVITDPDGNATYIYPQRRR